MKKDTLFLLEPRFNDPAYSGQAFYCEDCAVIEGVLSYFPELAANLQVERVAWPRPREAVVRLVGVENQSLPLLILNDGAASSLATGAFDGVYFVSGKREILNALGRRYGVPLPHP